MRIPDAYRPPQTLTEATGPRPGRDEGAAPTASTASVTVTMSDKARELSNAASGAANTKVTYLQQVLANGSFKVDPQAIADRLVQGD